jgi:acyl-CoA synthetase (AMP-forming)/AMP-acid ligase II
MSGPLDFLRERFAAVPEAPALLTEAGGVTYGELLASMDGWAARLRAAGVAAGAVVLLKGDYTAASVGALLALLDLGAVVVPVSPTSYEKLGDYAEIAEAEFVVETLEGEAVAPTGRTAANSLYAQLRAAGEGGLVIFTSGSTGQPKGALHAASRLVDKFRTPRRNLRTLAFLLFDHIAGVDTLFYCLSNASPIVAPAGRDPEAVCRAIAAGRAEVLPTAPSFLNLLLLSGAAERHDLSSLKIVTYGSEMMPQATLERAAEAFPNAQLIQRYGASELGSPRSQSKDNRSRWVRIGGDGVDWRVRDGKLEVRSRSAMVGYLNAPSPFTDDGYFMTGDLVEVDGEFIRFLGRDSDVINVGGQKVHPAEIEALLQPHPAIAEVAVYGEPNPILGAVVACKVRPVDPETTASALRLAIRTWLAGKVEGYKIPQRVTVTTEPLSSVRGKLLRR